MSRSALLANESRLEPRHGFTRTVSDGGVSSSCRTNLHLDRSLGAAVDELIDIWVAGTVDLGGWALPDDPPLVQHRNSVRDLACAHEGVGYRHRRGAALAHASYDQIVNDVGHDRI